MIEVLMPVYRVTEYKDGAVYRTEPAGERWVPIADTTKTNLGDDLFLGVPEKFVTRRV